MSSDFRRGRVLVLLLIAMDTVAVVAAFFIALELRFEFAAPPAAIANLLLALPLLMLVYLLSFLSMGIYARKWKFASFDEICAIAKAASLATAVICCGLLLFSSLRAYAPISVVFMGAAVSILALSSTRIGCRITSEIRARRANRDGIRVLLIGAGEAGEMIAREMLHHPELGYLPCAFVDDNPLKRKLILQGVPVSGSREDIPRITEDLCIAEIIITIPSAEGRDIREIVDICSMVDAKVKILPGLTRMLEDGPGLSYVREVQVEDLLGREPVELDLELICDYLYGKTVLVTGAAGSIGSELSREILRFHPERLVLLDNDESALFNLQYDLLGIGGQFDLVIADIREAQRIWSVFEKYRPDIVFHSAALKHVPMMETHPCEAVKNNVMGTVILADAAAYFECDRFLLISTDKAVQPSNVMGATKRLSEVVMKKYNAIAGTAFGAVRFGNVLGSRGSVVPIFETQIRNGGPVLVTDPDVTRYFMTINEAAQLVIQAGAYLHDGELFILDMGEPIKILELAKKMIAIIDSKAPIDIKFTGLRPGEKMHEELSYRHEQLLQTHHPKIATIGDHNGIPKELYSQIGQLVFSAREEREEDTYRLLMNLVRWANQVPQVKMDEEFLSRAELETVREGTFIGSS